MTHRSLNDVLSRPAPFDLDAEMSVLGSVLLMPEVFTELGALRGVDFFDDANRIIFDAAKLIYADKRTLDITMLVSHLRKIGQYEAVGGAPHLARLSSAVPNAAHAQHYAEIVKERSAARRLIQVASDAIVAAYDPDTTPQQAVGELRGRLDQLASDTADGDQTVTLHEAAKQRLELIENPGKSNLGTLVGSGVACIDETYGGFRRGGSYVIAARPGQGKSALMKQIAGSLDERAKPSLIVSLEMDPHEVAARILSERTGIDGKQLEVDENGDCQLTAAELDNLRIAVNDAQHSVIKFNAPHGRNATLEGITAHARLAKAKHGIEVLAVDYLQLIHKSHSRQSDYEKVTACSQVFKQLARELNIVVLLLAQLNRENEKGQAKPRRPRLSDLRDSGSIEQDADGVMFLHRTDEQSKAFELIVAKWRGDSNGAFGLKLDGAHTRFVEQPIEDHPNYQNDFAEFA